MNESEQPPGMTLAAKAQKFLDELVPHTSLRYLALFMLLLVFCIRIVSAQGYYVVAYGLGIYLLKLAVLFVQPLVDPEQEEDESVGLPLQNDDHKPFIRKMPEFKVWLSASKAVGIALVMTLIPLFDIPVFWPILLMYFILLFALTAKKQILHMWRHKYVPFNVGKKRYGKGGPTVKEYEK
ncbi:Protein RER1B [Diplonema papillatum]|nr:Protein RER1B [Diplonema papillatum]